MAPERPTVAVTGQQGRVLYDPAQGGAGIPLDSPAWPAWLDAATTRGFAYPVYDAAAGYIVGWLTVRKERRQRGGDYWSVYRRQGGRLRRVYLGGAAAVTAARLEEIARALR